MLLLTGAVCHLQLPRLHHRPGRRHPGSGGRPSPPRRDRERHPRPQVRRRTEPSPFGALRRQRSLAGGAGDGPQPGSLDGAPRSGRAAGDHQDPPTTLLLHSRTAHPLGAPPHFASSTALALGNPVQWRPGTTARHPTPSLTAPSSPDPLTGQPIVPANSHQLGPRGTLPAYRLSIPPAMAARPPSSCQCGCLTPPSSPSIGSTLRKI